VSPSLITVDAVSVGADACKDESAAVAVLALDVALISLAVEL